MGQGLSGAPSTYSKLGDIMTGPIPKPHPEPSLEDVDANVVFRKFINDDIGGATTVASLLAFLYDYYFPRLA